MSGNGIAPFAYNSCCLCYGLDAVVAVVDYSLDTMNFYIVASDGVDGWRS